MIAVARKAKNGREVMRLMKMKTKLSKAADLAAAGAGAGGGGEGLPPQPVLQISHSTVLGDSFGM